MAEAQADLKGKCATLLKHVSVRRLGPYQVGERFLH